MNKREFLRQYAEQLELDAIYCRRVAPLYSKGQKAQDLRAYWDSKAENLEQKAQKARAEARRLQGE